MVIVVRHRCFPAGENKGKVPKRIHKSEREKLKREQLNELFLELASALGKFNGFFFLTMIFVFIENWINLLEFSFLEQN